MYGKSTHSNASNVAHNWANKYEGKFKKDTIAGSLFYSGRTIYSYGHHFPIAKHVTNEQGQSAVLFTYRGYSNTTARHISTVWQATNGAERILCSNPEGNHEHNLQQWLAKAEGCHYESKKAKQQRTKLKALTGLTEIAEQVKIYCEFFGLDVNKENPVLVEALKCSAPAQLAEYTEKKEQAKKAAEAIRQAKLKKQHTKELKEFRKFERGRTYTHNGLDYLRFNTETQRVETSQQVEVPLRTAKAFYKQVLDIVKSGNCTLCGSQFMDKFEIYEINKEFIKVGCHKITIKEIQKLATQLNW